MTDPLTNIKKFLEEKTNINNIAIIPHVELMPLEKQFPAIGILDGGDQLTPGASEGLRKHHVFLAAYSQQIGERETAVLEVRTILETLIPLLENPQNFYQGAAFAGFNGCRYKKSSESRPLVYEQHDEQKSYIVIKLAIFEFTETYCEE